MDPVVKRLEGMHLPVPRKEKPSIWEHEVGGALLDSPEAERCVIKGRRRKEGDRGWDGGKFLVFPRPDQ